MSKPIVFYDLETTGKNDDKDKVRIIEISALKVNPETLDIIDTLYYKCNNDGVPIDPDATKETFEFFKGCDVGGYYCSIFDNLILYYSFIRSGFTWDFKNLKNYDIYTLYRKFHPGKLKDVFKIYTGKDLEDAHHARADVEATLEVYKEMRKMQQEFDESELDTYSDYLDMAGKFKIRILEDGKKDIYITFGKWKDVSVDKVDASYLKWMMENESFSIDTRHYAQKIYELKAKK